MKRANSRPNLRIISHWGDCIILHLQSGNRIEIIRPDGSEITPETNEKGKGKRNDSQELKQVELFGADNDYTAIVYAHPDLLMSADQWSSGKIPFKISPTVGKKEMQ